MSAKMYLCLVYLYADKTYMTEVKHCNFSQFLSFALLIKIIIQLKPSENLLQVEIK